MIQLNLTPIFLINLFNHRSAKSFSAGHNLKKDQLLLCIEAVDGDGSGSVDFDEFLQLMAKKTSVNGCDLSIDESCRYFLLCCFVLLGFVSLFCFIVLLCCCRTQISF